MLSIEEEKMFVLIILIGCYNQNTNVCPHKGSTGPVPILFNHLYLKSEHSSRRLYGQKLSIFSDFFLNRENGLASLDMS